MDPDPIITVAVIFAALVVLAAIIADIRRKL